MLFTLNVLQHTPAFSLRRSALSTIRNNYAFFSALAAVFLVLAGLALPKDLLEILPLLVLISPLPIVIIIYSF